MLTEGRRGAEGYPWIDMFRRKYDATHEPVVVRLPREEIALNGRQREATVVVVCRTPDTLPPGRRFLISA